jgi:hypothetical protein
MGKRYYLIGEKADALALLQANRGNVKQTARELGVPRRTLGDWSHGKGVDEEVRRMTERSKKRLAANFMQEAQEAVRAAAEKRPKATYRDLMIGAAVAVDKAQLLGGSSEAPPEPVEAAARRRAKVRGLITQIVERGSAQGNMVTRKEVAAEIVKRHPELTEMIADAEGPCPLCGATGHALAEAADPLPHEPSSEAIELLTYSESQAPPA